MRRCLIMLGFAIASLVGVSGVARAHECPEDQVLTIRKTVEATCPCAAQASPKDYKKCVKAALKADTSLEKDCKKHVTAATKKSTCGKAGSVVCCGGGKKGTKAFITKDAAVCTGKKKGTACETFATSSFGAFPVSIDDCTDDNKCPEEPAPPPPDCITSVPKYIDFEVRALAGDCGEFETTSFGIIPLPCAALGVGGGASSVPPAPVPDGGTNRFEICCASETDCEITSSDQTEDGVDCSVPGCRFGAPLPISNPPLSTCVINKFIQNGSGTANLQTGVIEASIPLQPTTYLVGDDETPCPICVGGEGGSPSSPKTGTCEDVTHSATPGAPCTSRNSIGLSSDCLPLEGLALPPFLVTLSPLTTGDAEKTAADGLFCPTEGQGLTQVGCFGAADCTRIKETGAPFAAPVVANTPAEGILAAVFCIPATGDALIDGAASLPGPGAVTLPYNAILHD